MNYVNYEKILNKHYKECHVFNFDLAYAST